MKEGTNFNHLAIELDKVIDKVISETVYLLRGNKISFEDIESVLTMAIRFKVKTIKAIENRNNDEKKDN